MRKSLRHILWMLLGIFLAEATGQAQLNQPVDGNPDSLFIVAQQAAFNGDYVKCRKLCFQVLNNYPEYNDFRILAARTFAWEGKVDSARYIMQPLTEKSPPEKNTLLAMADIAYYEPDLEEALRLIDSALSQYPGDSLLLSRRNSILEAFPVTSGQPTAINPLDPDSNAIGMMYYFGFFKHPYVSRRHMLSVQYTRINPEIPFALRTNMGDFVLPGEFLFENPDFQVEADAYPKLDAQSYLYLNYGIGQGPFFPLHRAGLEYFRGIGNGFEISGGMRYMYWDRSILFLTGSLAKYLGPYWLSFRPFFAIAGKNFANAYLLEARRYLKPVNSYLFAQILYGDSPDQPLALAEDFGNFTSSRYSLGVQYRYNQWLLNSSIGYQYEEYLTNQFRNRFDIRIGVHYVF